MTVYGPPIIRAKILEGVLIVISCMIFFQYFVRNVKTFPSLTMTDLVVIFQSMDERFNEAEGTFKICMSSRLGLPEVDWFFRHAVTAIQPPAEIFVSLRVPIWLIGGAVQH